MSPATPEGTNQAVKTPDIHPLMDPEKVKAIWHKAQKEWTPKEDMVREIEREREEWDQRIP